MIEPKKLPEPRFKLSEHVMNRWFVTAEAGTTIEEILDRSYWSHVARSLRPYDEIRVAIDSGEWLIVLHVHSAGQNWANVVLLQRFDNLSPAAAAPDEQGSSLEVQWRGPHAKFCVMRKGDGSVVKDRFQDRVLADMYIKNFEGSRVA